MPELLSVKEVARLLRLHELTVRRHIRSGRLRAVKVGGRYRVEQEDLDSFIVPVSTSEMEQRERAAHEERKAAAERILERREQVGPIGVPVADLIKEGRRNYMTCIAYDCKRVLEYIKDGHCSTKRAHL